MKNNLFRTVNLAVGKVNVTLVDTFTYLLDGVTTSAHNVTNKKIFPALCADLTARVKEYNYQGIVQFAKAISVCQQAVEALICAKAVREYGTHDERVIEAIESEHCSILYDIEKIFVKKFKDQFIQREAISFTLDYSRNRRGRDYYPSFSLTSCTSYREPFLSRKELMGVIFDVKKFPFNKYNLSSFEKALREWIDENVKVFENFDKLVELHGDDIVNWQTTHKYHAVCKKAEIELKSYAYDTRFLFHLLDNYRIKLEKKGLTPIVKSKPEKKENPLKTSEDRLRAFKAGELKAQDLTFDELVTISEEETKVAEKRRDTEFFVTLVAKAVSAKDHFRKVLSVLGSFNRYAVVTWDFVETFVGELKHTTSEILPTLLENCHDFKEISKELYTLISQKIPPTKRLEINDSVSHAYLNTLSESEKLVILSWYINHSSNTYKINLKHSASIFDSCAWESVRQILLVGSDDDRSYHDIAYFLKQAIKQKDQDILLAIAQRESVWYGRGASDMAYQYLTFENKCKLITEQKPRFSNNVTTASDFWVKDDFGKLANIIFTDPDFSRFTDAVIKHEKINLSDWLLKGKIKYLRSEFASQLTDEALIAAIEKAVFFDDLPYSEIQSRFERSFIEKKLKISVIDNCKHFPKLLTNDELKAKIDQFISHVDALVEAKAKEGKWSYGTLQRLIDAEAKFIRKNLDIFSSDMIAVFENKVYAKALCGDLRASENKAIAEQLARSLANRTPLKLVLS